MKRLLSQRMLDQSFRFVVTLKGLDGILEIIGGILLLIIPMSRLQGWMSLATYELTEDHHAFIAHTLGRLDHSLTPGIALFGALYLIGHGAIKLLLMAALLREHYRLYPIAISFLLLFIFYQTYRVGLDHSAFLAALTAFDALLTWLIYLEWRRHAGPDRSPVVPLPQAKFYLPTPAKRLILFGVLSLALLGSGASLAFSWPQADQASRAAILSPTDELNQTYDRLKQMVQNLETRQQQAHLQVVQPGLLQLALDHIHAAIGQGNAKSARQQIAELHATLSAGNQQLDYPTVASPSAAVSTASHNASDLFVPIVLYHYTPTNFEQQLEHLEQHGYTTVDLDQVAAAMHDTGTLPAKPVVITYDDGFANQMEAFALLQRHHMKATFYIINGGEMSKWCIGAGRRSHDPLQPPQGCGDAYLSWDQVRQLDHSGLITIAGHTLDHPSLPTLSPEMQRHEIADSKAGIEQEIGHPIHHFAYPYGAFNATTVDLVKEAGYITATTTQPGDYQAPGSLFTLRRIRDTLTLP